jgi:hypothetical protein
MTKITTQFAKILSISYICIDHYGNTGKKEAYPQRG